MRGHFLSPPPRCSHPASPREGILHCRGVERCDVDVVHSPATGTPKRSFAEQSRTPGGEMIFEADFPPPMAYCYWGGLARGSDSAGRLLAPCRTGYLQAVPRLLLWRWTRSLPDDGSRCWFPRCGSCIGLLLADRRRLPRVGSSQIERSLGEEQGPMQREFCDHASVSLMSMFWRAKVSANARLRRA
jgi:hypothetical protein